MIISVDAGKGFTKYAYADEEGKFKRDMFETRYTEVGELDNRPPGEDSFDVEYEDKRYVLGVQGEYDLREDRSKMLDIHRISTLVAITEALGNKTKGEEIDLVVSMPAASYTNKKQNEEFKEFYKGSGDVEITVNGVDYSFKIRNVETLPEGAGFSFKHPELCKGNITIFDIGHLNINILSMRDNNILSMISLDDGGKELEANLIRNLEAEVDKEINPNVIIDSMINNRYVEFGDTLEGSEEVIAKVKSDYVNSLLKKASDRDVDIAISDKIYFIGGTSELLEEQIKVHDKLQKVAEVREDGRWITVEGNLMYGTVVFGEDSNE